MLKTHQLLAIIVTLIWGTNFVFIKYGLNELPPFLFATLRFIVVAFPLVFFVTRPKVSWRSIIAYGVLIGFGQFGLLFYAMQTDISPGLASLVVHMQVFFSIIFAIILFKETLNATQWFALFISFSGIALIAVNIIKPQSEITTILGLSLVLVAASSWGLGNMVAKSAGKIDYISFLAYSSLFAVPILAMMSLYLEGWNLIQSSIQNASLTSVYVVLWQAIGNTLIGYGAWNFLLTRYSAADVTPWSLLVPISGMLASSLMLKEPMPLWKILAAVLVIAGLLLNIYGSKKSAIH